MYHYAGNNPVRFVDPDGRSNNVVVIGEPNGAGQNFEIAGNTWISENIKDTDSLYGGLTTQADDSTRTYRPDADAWIESFNGIKFNTGATVWGFSSYSFATDEYTLGHGERLPTNNVVNSKLPYTTKKAWFVATNGKGLIKFTKQ